MAFIRVTDFETKAEVDINAGHIVAYTGALDEDNKPIDGTYISLVGGGVYHVIETPRTVRGFVRVATDNAPKTTRKSPSVAGKSPEIKE